MALDGAGSWCLFFTFFLLHIAVVTWMTLSPPYSSGGSVDKPVINWTGWMTAIGLWKMDNTPKGRVCGARLMQE
jgi:hypothetical protein